MKVEVISANLGRMGASFQVVTGELKTPRLSVHDAEKLVAELNKSLNSHFDRQRGRK